MLTRNSLMIRDNHVVRFESVAAVAVHRILNNRAEIRDEMRDSAHILRDERAVRHDERRTEIPHLIDHHVVGGPLNIRGHFIRNGRQRVADHLQGYRIDLCRHYPLPTEMTSSPVRETTR